MASFPGVCAARFCTAFAINISEQPTQSFDSIYSEHLVVKTTAKGLFAIQYTMYSLGEKSCEALMV